MLKTAWLSLGSPRPRSRWLSFVLSGVAIFADLYRRLSRAPEAEMAYRKALSMSQQEPERRYLTRRLAELQKQ
jgi:predicted RNA polymerase sigma factor